MFGGGFRRKWRDATRSLWFLPTLSVFIALAAGYLLSLVEVEEGDPLSDLLFRGSADDARQLLVVVSGTMITVTGLVFVLTVVALQIASTQFSPRLLRSFLQDPGTRLVLSVFVATFAYSLGGLFTVGQLTPGGEEFVPRLAVTGSLLLALVSVGMLVYYIQHITNSIRIDTVMYGVERSTLEAIRRHHPDPVNSELEGSDPPAVPENAFVVPVSSSGYLEEIDVEGLHKLAADQELSIRIRPQIGHHLVAGSALAWVWSPRSAAFDAESVVAAVNRAVAITVERRIDHDIGFGVRQLVDIELKAVAPSINDPYTAVQSVQHLSIIMTELAALATEDIRVMDDGELRVFVPVPKFNLFLETLCSNVRRSAAGRPRVLVELLRLLETVAATDTSPARREAVARQIRLVVEDAERAIDQPSDLAPVLEMAEDAAFAAAHGRVDHR